MISQIGPSRSLGSVDRDHPLRRSSVAHPFSGGWLEPSGAGRQTGSFVPERGLWPPSDYPCARSERFCDRSGTSGRATGRWPRAWGSAAAPSAPRCCGPGPPGSIGPRSSACPTRSSRPACMGPDAAQPPPRRSRLRLPPRRAAEARRHPGVAAPRAAPRGLSLYPVLRVLPPLVQTARALDAPGPSRRREVFRRLRRDASLHGDGPRPVRERSCAARQSGPLRRRPRRGSPRPGPGRARPTGSGRASSRQHSLSDRG